jgi:hypothetical protein
MWRPLGTLARAPAGPVVLALSLLLLSGRSFAQNNDCLTVILHGVEGVDLDCQTEVDSVNVQPTVRIDDPAPGIYTVIMYIRNYAGINGIQVAFDWPMTWSFGFGLWNCQPGQIIATMPTAPGPITGTITTAFECIAGGELAPIGVLFFNSIGPGCLTLIESGYPFGNHFIDACEGPYESIPIHDENEGSICVNAPGANTCQCAVTAVESATWGGIKGTYGR